MDDPWWLNSVGVEMSLLVASCDCPDSLALLEADLSADEGHANHRFESGLRPVRLAWLVGAQGADVRVIKHRLFARGFTVFAEPTSSFESIGGALIGLLSAVWLRGIVCVDFLDILTLLTRRGGMQGCLISASMPMIRRGIQRARGIGALPSGQGALVFIYTDGSLSMEDLVLISEDIRGALCAAASYDIKVLVYDRPEGDRLLAGEQPRVLLLLTGDVEARPRDSRTSILIVRAVAPVPSHAR
ncbi:MAG: hypothetical protein VX836_04675 [Pseudomonadota bacterium]|nr:hypothetical protein [Pseudomonadota bacterium]